MDKLDASGIEKIRYEKEQEKLNKLKLKYRFTTAEPEEKRLMASLSC